MRHNHRWQLWSEIGIGVLMGVTAFLAVSGVNVLPVVLVAALVLAFVYQSRGQIGPQRFAATVANPVAVSFDDIGGQGTAKRELIEAIDFLAHKKEAEALGIRPLKGILLAGPPGTGKTMLAKAAATYTNSVFLSASGSEFVEVYAGVGAQRVRRLFNDARAAAERAARHSAIIFIDEIDVLGGQRGRHQSHLEYDQTLNQLLVEMDGIQASKVQILVIGATNRPDLLDPALLRPGRFDRIVRVDLPDYEGRLAILQLHSRQRPLAADVDLAEVAHATYGFSGAQLESLVNEAAILALRRGLSEITGELLHEAIDKVMLGDRAERSPGQDERRRVAYHEAGHALVSEMVRPGSVATVTIAPRGQAMGYVRHAFSDDLHMYTMTQLENEIAVLLAGSAAEKLVLGDRSTGATNDLNRAVELARTMVQNGMSALGFVDAEDFHSEDVKKAVSDILTAQEKRCTALLTLHRRALDEVTSDLIKHETIAGQVVQAALRNDEQPALAG